MKQTFTRGSGEQALTIDLLEVLNGSLELRAVLDAAFPLLVKLVPADYGALCVSRSQHAGDYDWTTVDFPVDWFSAYADMAPHDFVRQAVVARPNVVLRDSEMISRRELEMNMMYRRAQELRVPLEHVMSVMVDFGTDWHAGLNLYRGRSVEFSEANRNFLQRFTPALGSAVRNCKLFADRSRTCTLLDAILRHRGFEALVMVSPSKELARTEGATAMIGRWFEPDEIDRSGVPSVLLERLGEAMRRHGQLGPQVDPWTRAGPDATRLQVSIASFRDAHSTLWALVLQEVRALPAPWRRLLTPREYEVASRVVIGWDNRLIADDLKCKIGTVKKHIDHIFTKLGASSRSSLGHLASQWR